MGRGGRRGGVLFLSRACGLGLSERMRGEVGWR